MEYNQNVQNFKNKKVKFKKNFLKRTKNFFLVDNLTNDLYEYLSNIVSEKVATKASIYAREIFTYYIDTKAEEIILVLEKKYNSWNILFKVCPSYLDEYQNLKKIQCYLNKNTTVISLKGFYFKNIKKYYN